MNAEQRLESLKPLQRKVAAVIDTDTFNEIDDQFALVYALLSQESIDVIAVHACPFFNERSESPAHGMELSYQEIIRVLEVMGHTSEEFVYRGVTEYVGFAKEARQGDAVDHLIELAEDYSANDPLYVIAIGAISNVASAILRNPQIVDRLVVVWLGGDAKHWPRSFDESVAFNLSQDVGAGQVVFDSGVPLVYVPTAGVSSHLLTTVPEIDRYVQPNGEIGAFLASRFRGYNKVHRAWGKELWDMAAVACVINAEWTPSELVPTPVLGDDMGWNEASDRHVMRYVGYVSRNQILGDFFEKLERFASQ